MTQLSKIFHNLDIMAAHEIMQHLEGNSLLKSHVRYKWIGQLLDTLWIEPSLLAQFFI